MVGWEGCSGREVAQIYSLQVNKNALSEGGKSNNGLLDFGISWLND